MGESHTPNEEAALRADPEDRFRLLFELNASAVARYAARRVPADEVQDVIAETFLTAWRRLDDVPEDAVPWLFATARLQIANTHRTSRRRRALHERFAAVISEPVSRPEAAVDEIDAELLEAIHELPDLEREALMLVAWEGLDPRRASRVVGCSAATFRVRLHRARRRVKKRLAAPLNAPIGPVRLQENPMEEAR